MVTPCFNHARVVERALRSAARQTLLPVEIIVVDDGSHDASVQMVRAFALASAVPVILLCLPENRGPAAARNAGWEVARGEFVAFLDADDAWHPQKLALQRPLFDDPRLALCGHPFMVVNDEGRVPRPLGVPVTRELNAAELVRHNRLFTSSVMLRRDQQERFREDQRYGEDYMLWLEIVLKGRYAAVLQLPLLLLFKSSYGEGGLSMQLWLMQRGELMVYVRAWHLGLLRAPQALAAVCMSMLKYLRRLVFVKFRLFRASR